MIRDHNFAPATLTVASGETITWMNETDETHTVTAFEKSFPDGAEYFSSGGASTEEEAKDSLPNELIDPGESFTVTLDEAGTYSYYCIPHMQDGMRGMIVVE